MKDFLYPSTKRIFIITGHYGSGKTEFAVSLALLLAKQENRKYKKMALIDLDIDNPYFRSRERRDLLEAAGIPVYGSFYKSEITAELPALSVDIRIPLEDKECFTIIDLGGNDSGARVLNQFSKYFQSDEHAMLTVINANRPETRDLEGAIYHLECIEIETGLNVTGLINNCHLVRETTADTIAKGHRLCQEVSKATSIPIWCDCYPAPLVKREDLHDIGKYAMPIGMYMRQSWLDK